MKRLMTVCLSVLLVLAMTLCLSGCFTANNETTTSGLTDCQHLQVTEAIVKEANCGTAGEKTLTCQACGNVQTVVIPAAASHNFNGFACVDCAAPKGISGENITTLLESLESEGYTLDFSGLTATLHEGERTETQTLSLGKLSAVMKDGKLLFSMEVSSEEEDQTVMLYGDGEFVYIQSSNDDYDVYSYEEILGEVGAGTEDMPENEEELKELLASLIGQENLDLWTQVLENNQAGYLEWAAELFGNCFRVEADGKTFTLDMAALRQFNENAYTLTIPALFDACYGEGSFSKLQGQVTDLGDMTLAKAVKELFAMAAERGISEKMLVSTVNAILAANGEEVDFGEMLESAEFQSTTVADFVSSMMSEDGEPQPDFKWDELVAGYFGAVVDVKLYDLLYAEDPKNAEYLYTFINELCSQEKLAVQLVLSPEGKLESAKITLNELLFPQDETSEIHFSGTISFTLEGGISAEGPALKEKLEGWKQAVLDGLKVGIQNSEDGMLVYKRYHFSLNDDGSIRLEDVWSYSGESEIYADISKFIIMAEPDCTDMYGFRIRNTDGSSIMYITYINVKTGEILEDSAHDWQEYIPNDLPAGTPTSPEEVGCGEEYYQGEKCANCGAVEEAMVRTVHPMGYRYYLAEGSVTCEDGAYREEYCLNCGEVGGSYPYNWHEENMIREAQVPAAYGVLTVSVYACPCGYDTGIDISYDHDDENCCVISDYYPDEYEEDPITGEMRGYYYCQTHEDCGFYMVCRSNVVDSGNPCLQSFQNDYRFYLMDEQVGDAFKVTINVYSHDYESYVPDALPEGIPEGTPTSPDGLTCGDTMYYAEKCVSCGVTRGGIIDISHNFSFRYILAEGAVTCEDGAYREQYCLNCGEVGGSYSYNWHGNNLIREAQVPAAYGVLTVSVYACPCGYDTGIDISYDHDDENCCVISDYYPDEYEEDPITGEMRGYYYCQTHEDCGFYMVCRSNVVDSGNPCLQSIQNDYRFYLMDEQVGDAFKVTINVYSHDYESYIPDVLPEGVPEDAVFNKDDVACGEDWYAFYRCTECGEISHGWEYKDHDYHYSYSLKEGSTSCTDGLIEQYSCRVCDRVSYQEEVNYGHNMLLAKQTVIKTAVGQIIVAQYACLCGQEQNCFYWSDTDQDTCSLNGSSMYNEIITNADGLSGVRFWYRCSKEHLNESGEIIECGLLMYKDEYRIPVEGEPCLFWYYCEYRFYHTEEFGQVVQVGDVFYDILRDNIYSDHDTNGLLSEDTLPDGNKKQIFTNECAEENCDYTETHTYIYNSDYTQLFYREYITIYQGVTEYHEIYEYKYLDDGSVFVTYTNVLTGESNSYFE